MNVVVTITEPQAKALRDITNPKYKMIGCPNHLINNMVSDSLMSKGLIKVSINRSSGVRLIVTQKFRDYRYKLIEVV